MMKFLQRPHREVTLSLMWISVLGLVFFNGSTYERLSATCLTEYQSLPVSSIAFIGTGLLMAIALLSGFILAIRGIEIFEGDRAWNDAHE